MKKNRTMKLGASLAALALVTTCFTSGTIAKYTSTQTADDTARVAKWGFNTTALNVDLFATNYDNVASADQADVIAPGTTKEQTISLVPQSGTAPEVAYSYTLALAATAGADTDLLDKLTWSLNGVQCDNFADLISDVAALSQNKVEANALPTSQNITIGWSWAYENNEDLETTDAADTDLGNAPSLAELGVKLTVTATQLD